MIKCLKDIKHKWHKYFEFGWQQCNGLIHLTLPFISFTMFRGTKQNNFYRWPSRSHSLRYKTTSFPNVFYIDCR